MKSGSKLRAWLRTITYNVILHDNVTTLPCRMSFFMKLILHIQGLKEKRTILHFTFYYNTLYSIIYTCIYNSGY